MEIDRIDVVRRLLGTATQLFLDDQDPVSVHCLAASALEHAEFLVETKGQVPFRGHVLATFPNMNSRDVKRLRNFHYRAIKHSHDRGGTPFDVSLQLADFDDTKNDAVLFVGWYDFMKSGAPVPIAAQVFQIWYFHVYPGSLGSADQFNFSTFDGLGSMERSSQKALLRRAISDAFRDYDVVSDVRTDTRDLVLR